MSTKFDLDNQICQITYEHNSYKIELNMDYLITIPPATLEHLARHEGNHLHAWILNKVNDYKKGEKGYIVELPTTDSSERS